MKDVRRFAERWKKEHSAAVVGEESPDPELFAKASTRLAVLAAATRNCSRITIQDAVKLKRLQNEMNEALLSAEKIMRKYGGL